jgi:hypothetical protein
MAMGLAAGCGGGGGGTRTDTDLASVPVAPHGPPTPVDVCALVTPEDMTHTLGRAMRPVGLQYQSTKLATLRCDLGEDFGRPELSVTLAIGPISQQVFNDAYGEAAGGDPVAVKRLAAAAIIRTEAGQKSLHVLVHGSILTLSAALDSASPIRRTALLELAAASLSHLPSNPVLASTRPGQRCSEVPTSAVTAAVGARPALSSQFGDQDGSLSCSWTALPGAAVATVFTSPEAVASYQELAETAEYHRVDLQARGSGVSATSRADRAGDLLILTGQIAIVLTVEPTAGFADPAIKTTPGERTLANAVLDAFT